MKSYNPFQNFSPAKLFVALCTILLYSTISTAQKITTAEKLKTFVKTETEQEDDESANEMIDYFQLLHYPYSSLTAEQVNEIKAAVAATPSEKSVSILRSSSSNEWAAVGPYGMRSHDTPYRIFSGRVTGVETSSGEMRVLSASGNLWHYLNLGITLIPVSMSDNLNSQWGGAFVTSPTDTSIIFLGTGEPHIHEGTGLWKTTDLGNTWNSIPMNPVPESFYKIFYDPSNSQIMHAATNVGYYRSLDGGNSWTRYL
ncbi:MAG TPA: hypothetical protein PKK99_01020, partial [Bacteroidia bacterium]|nr:hypothetical protein [Bacteroidia bacterium]